MNVVILASRGKVEESSRFSPNLLLEIDNKLLLEYFVEKLQFRDVINKVFVIDSSDIKNHNLDKVINLSCNNNASISIVNSPTKGALCSFMLTIDNLIYDQELLILNSNELLNISYQKPIDEFYKQNADAGAVIFDSVRPIYSYVELDESEKVVFASEKDPISKNATAGFYWYKTTEEFLDCAEQTILKNCSHDELFYICPVFNQMILKRKKIATYRIDESSYIPIKSSLQKEKIILQSGRVLDQ